MSVIIPKDCFHQPQVADLRLIACPGAEELTNLIDKHLVRWASEAGYQTNSFIIEITRLLTIFESTSLYAAN